MNIRSTQEELEIAKFLSKKICNKSVQYDRNIYQTPTVIYGIDAVYIVHEVCHWIACAPEYRHLENLGYISENQFDISYLYGNRAISSDIYRLLYDECIACILTKMIYRKYFSCIDNSEGLMYSHIARVNYIGDNVPLILAGKLDIDIQVMSNIAEKLFNEYCNRIDKRII